jgi:DNA-binding Lrp family transcriptional regulator
MAAAYVLMNVDAGKVGRALSAVKAVKGVKTAHAVAGPYDIILFVEAENLEKLGQRVLLELQIVSGIRSTVTAVVFQSP